MLVQNKCVSMVTCALDWKQREVIEEFVPFIYRRTWYICPVKIYTKM